MKKISDSFAFARDGRVLEGTLAVASLERLHDLLAEVSGELAFRIEGYKGERGQSMLHLEVNGALPLACQRCLDGIRFELDVDSLLELIPEGSELSQDELEDDTRDFLPVAKELDVAELKINVDNVSDPEPSSTRRTTSLMAFWRLTCRRFCKVVKRSPDALSLTPIHLRNLGCKIFVRILNGT